MSLVASMNTNEEGRVEDETATMHGALKDSYGPTPL